MNKHIIGLIVFSFIVGMSAIVAAFFVRMPPIPEVAPVKVSESNEYVYRGRTSCKKKKRKPRPKSSDLASAKVSQAVFDLNKKYLNTEFIIERATDSTENINVALHFFVNDSFGAQHIATEFVTLTPNFDIGDKAMTSKLSSFNWLSNLESRENLYVMAEVVDTNYSYEKLPPVFDSYEATAVLVSPRTVKTGGILQ